MVTAGTGQERREGAECQRKRTSQKQDRDCPEVPGWAAGGTGMGRGQSTRPNYLETFTCPLHPSLALPHRTSCSGSLWNPTWVWFPLFPPTPPFSYLLQLQLTSTSNSSHKGPCLDSLKWCLLFKLILTSPYGSIHWAQPSLGKASASSRLAAPEDKTMGTLCTPLSSFMGNNRLTGLS